jgi:hypothetical protein
VINEAELAPLGLGLPQKEDEPRLLLSFWRRLRTTLWFHRRSVAVVGVLIIVVAAVHVIGMNRYPALADDEGTYVAQAWSAQVHHRLAHYTYWYDHPPLGWLQMAAWTWVTAAFSRVASSVFAGREVALLADVASAALVYALGRRLQLHRVASAAAVLLFALSPLALTFHRMVFLDNLAVPWILAAFVLAASPRGSLWGAAGSGFCFAIGILTKETFLILLPVLAWQVWSHCDRRTRRFCMTGFATVFALTAFVYPLYAVLKGELIPGAHHVSLIDAIRFQLFTRTGSGNVLHQGTVAHRIVSGWLSIDQWLLAGGLVATPFAFLRRQLRPLVAAFILQVVMLFRGGYLPAPFVIGLLPFCAVTVAAGFDVLWGKTKEHLSRPRRAGVVLRRVAVLALGAAAVGLVAPSWFDGDHTAMTADVVAPQLAAQRWITAHVPHESRMIVDDTLWVDLVQGGFKRKFGVVWFYKLDNSNNLDASVAKALPDGWRDCDYIVSTPELRAGLSDLPNGLLPIRQAMSSSHVVATFGARTGLVEVRKITR